MYLYYIFLLICLISIVQCSNENENGERKNIINKDVAIKVNNDKSPSRRKYVLALEPSCADDVKKYCHGDVRNNLFVLDCLANDLEEDDEISEPCQHTIWTFKRTLTKDTNFESTGKNVCKSDLADIDECRMEKEKEGHIVPCLIEHYEDVKEVLCKDFLEKMESIVFSDYRLVYKFIDRCSEDINKHMCGRLAEEKDPLPHDQGKTITCLMEKERELAIECKKEILHIAELQSGDFKRDRQLYVACKKDRERFCGSIMAGGGRVLKCLYDHKFHEDMSEKCREKLTLKQGIEQDDYKVNFGLSHECKQDIGLHNCASSSKNVGQEFEMAAVLLCLENAIKRNLKVSKGCTMEMRKIRKTIMEDYLVNPELLLGCQKEIQNNCESERRDKKVHCLLNLVHKDDYNKENQTKIVSKICNIALEKLIKEIAIADDPEIDPVFTEACMPTIKLQCSNVPTDKILDCLFDLIGRKINNEKLIAEECEDKLMEINYFITRDFTINTKFMKNCYKDLTTVCKMPKRIMDVSKEDQSIRISCLYRNKKSLSIGCSTELKTLLLERAKSVELDPDVQMHCVTDISNLCIERIEDELDCLEEKLEKLEDKCKEVVRLAIEMEDETPELTKIFVQSCAPFWKDHCTDKDEKDNSEVLDLNDKEDGEALMNCLIRNKNNKELPLKCRAAVEHHQIITLNDYTLSNEFKIACDKEVRAHCMNMTKKSEVIKCLSAHVLSDKLLEVSNPTIDAKCAKHLRFELLQQSESIKLDPELYQSCKDDINKFCPDVKLVNSSVLKCLRQPDHRQNLSPGCHAKLYSRDQFQAENERTDFELMTKCKRMIKKHCMEHLADGNILSCLANFKEEPNFDRPCFTVVIEKLRRRALDVRLNPLLQKSCKLDLIKFCQKEIEEAHQSKVEMEGVVLACLRSVFAGINGKERLTPRCNEHVASLIKESAMDYVQDARLAKQCKYPIQKFCLSQAFNDRDDMGDKSNVVECLKHQMLLNKITKEKDQDCWMEMLRVMKENRVDIHVDPILSRSCATELFQYCKLVDRGEGRKMSCLIEMYQKKMKMSVRCADLLKDRLELWERAVKLAPPESLGEAYEQLSSSPAKNYFLIVILTVLASIFLWGICCGRITKRVARQMKNR